MSANRGMITNLSSECWWLAFLLTLWLTLCFCARSCRHTLLSQVPAILLQDMTNLLLSKTKTQTNKQKNKHVKISKQRRVSGLGKGTGINHCRWKEELLIQNWVDHTLLGNLMWFLMTWLAGWSDTLRGQGVYLMPLCCVVSLPRWVSSLFTGEPSEPQLAH